MSIKGTLFSALAIVLIFSQFGNAENQNDKVVQDIVIDHFEKIFNVSKSDIQIRFIHKPDIGIYMDNSHRFSIEYNKRVPQLGYQNVGLNVFKGNCIVHRFSVMVDVSISLPLVVANRDLRRGEELTPYNTAMESRTISHDYENLVRDSGEVLGLVTKQIIRKGSILKQAHLKEKSDILRGEQVKIQLVSNDLIITTRGEVKQDGLVGDKVRVKCAITGKQLTGTVKSPQLVVVNLQ